MKLVFTEKLPTEVGFYWWTNFGEHTPTILEVRIDYSSGGDSKKLWASNEEFCFEIKPPSPQQELGLKEEVDPDDFREGKYRYGDELWCRIPNPFLPGGKKQVESDCY